MIHEEQIRQADVLVSPVNPIVNRASVNVTPSSVPEATAASE
jgi:hypothetical protein